MPKFEFDPSPIWVTWDYDDKIETLRKGQTQRVTYSRPVVYCGEVRIWEGKYEKWYSGPDEEDLKTEWDFHFQQFQAEQFKEWVRANVPGADKQVEDN